MVTYRAFRHAPWNQEGPYDAQSQQNGHHKFGATMKAFALAAMLGALSMPALAHGGGGAGRGGGWGGSTAKPELPVLLESGALDAAAQRVGAGDTTLDISRVDSAHVRWSITITNAPRHGAPANGEFYPISSDATASFRPTSTTLEATFKGRSG